MLKRLKKLILVSVKKCSRDKTDELASSSDSKQARSKVFFFHVLLSGLLPEDIPAFRVGFPASNNLIGKVPHRSAH